MSQHTQHSQHAKALKLVKSWLKTSMFYFSSTKTLDGKRSKNWTGMHEGNSRACWNVGGCDQETFARRMKVPLEPFSLLVEH